MPGIVARRERKPERALLRERRTEVPGGTLSTSSYILAAVIDCMWRAVTLNSPALRAAPPVSALEGEARRGAFQGCQTGVKVGYICVLVP